jgi:VRR-NUC domain.
MAAHPESILQRNCVTWFRLQHRALAPLLFAVPNGGGRSRVEAAIMKAEGVTAGVADLILLLPRGPYSSLCIEMKTPSKKSHQSNAQRRWQVEVEEAGNRYVVVRTFEEFQEIVRDYLKMPSQTAIQDCAGKLVNCCRRYLRQECLRSEFIAAIEDMDAKL